MDRIKGEVMIMRGTLKGDEAKKMEGRMLKEFGSFWALGKDNRRMSVRDWWTYLCTWPIPEKFRLGGGCNLKLKKEHGG
jgi:hypothetical protein